MTRIRKRYADGRWGQVHLRIVGEEQTGRVPLLMLHPTPKSGWIYEPLMIPLGHDRIVIAPDTPGYGASDPPPSPASIEALADEMLDVAQGVVGDGPIDVMGYHTGSVIAVAMALAAPMRVRRLVLTSLPTYSEDERAAKRAGLAQWRRPAADGSHLVAMWTLMQGLADPRAGTDWMHASFTENLRCGDRAPWGYEAVYRYDLESALGWLEHPALVLAPEDDLDRQTLRGIALMKDARIERLAGVGHGLFDLETDRIVASIRDFLDN